MAFYGTQDCTIDDKSRARIPTKWRYSLSENFVVVNGFGRPCLYVYPKEAFVKKVQSVDLSLTQLEEQEVISSWIGSAEDAVEDTQGRFVLKDHSLEYAGIKKNIIISGANDRLEIWAEEVYKERGRNTTEVMTKAAELMRNVRL